MDEIQISYVVHLLHQAVLVLLVAGVIFAPQIVAWYFGESPDAQAIHLAFRITIYCCAVPGLFLLLCLHRLLRNLLPGEGV